MEKHIQETLMELNTGTFVETNAEMINGDYAVSGFPAENNRTGTVCLFAKKDGSWEHRATLLAQCGNEFDDFGVSVDISRDGNTVLVGAPGACRGNQNIPGVVYIFTYDGGIWTQTETLQGPVSGLDVSFGKITILHENQSEIVVYSRNSRHSFILQDRKWVLVDRY